MISKKNKKDSVLKTELLPRYVFHQQHQQTQKLRYQMIDDDGPSVVAEKTKETLAIGMDTGRLRESQKENIIPRRPSFLQQKRKPQRRSSHLGGEESKSKQTLRASSHGNRKKVQPLAIFQPKAHYVGEDDGTHIDEQSQTLSEIFRRCYQAFQEYREKIEGLEQRNSYLEEENTRLQKMLKKM